MMIDKEKLVEQIADQTDIDPEKVREELEQLIQEIRQQTAKGDQFELEGFGTFYQEEDTLQFDPAESLETELNYKYSGMEPVELAESNKELPEDDSGESTESEAGQGEEQYEEEVWEEPTEEAGDAGEEETLEEDEPLQEEQSAEESADEEMNISREAFREDTGQNEDSFDFEKIFGLSDEETPEEEDEEDEWEEAEEVQEGQDGEDSGPDRLDETAGEPVDQHEEEEVESDEGEEDDADADKDESEPGEEDEITPEDSEPDKETESEEDEMKEEVFDLEELSEDVDQDAGDTAAETEPESAFQSEETEETEEDVQEEQGASSETDPGEEFPEKEPEKTELESDAEEDSGVAMPELDEQDLEEVDEEEETEKPPGKKKSGRKRRSLGIGAFMRRINEKFPIIPLFLISVAIVLFGFGFYITMNPDLRGKVTEMFNAEEEQAEVAQTQSGGTDAGDATMDMGGASGSGEAADQQEGENDANQQEEGGEVTPEKQTGTPSETETPEKYGLHGSWNSGGKSYTLIIYSFTNRSKAADIAKKLEQKDYRTTIHSAIVDGNRYYRVAVGQFESIDAAQAASAKLDEPYSKDYFIRYISNS